MIETYTNLECPLLKDIEQPKIKPQKLVKMYTVNFGPQYVSSKIIAVCGIRTSSLYESRKLMYSLGSIRRFHNKVGPLIMSKQIIRLDGLSSNMP
jgi:hypothetical protein